MYLDQREEPHECTSERRIGTLPLGSSVTRLARHSWGWYASPGTVVVLSTQYSSVFYL